MENLEVTTTRSVVKLTKGDNVIAKFDLRTGERLDQSDQCLPLWFAGRFLIPGATITTWSLREVAFARPSLSTARGCVTCEMGYVFPDESVVINVWGASVGQIQESCTAFRAAWRSLRGCWFGGVVYARKASKKYRLGKLSAGGRFYRDSHFNTNIKELETWQRKN